MVTGLRCLSLHQPWASLVALGVKSIETRSWATKHRGRIGIASTASVPAAHRMVGGFVWGKIGDGSFVIQDVRGADGYDGKRNVSAPLGALVATANLVDCVPIVDDGGARHCVDVRVGHPEAGAALRLDKREPGWPTTLVETITDILDQLPYGDFTPGRWAWLFDDVKPTTERCPRCWDAAPSAAPGVCVDIDGQWWHTPGSCRYCKGACELCIGGTRRVDPILVKGHQRLWEWTP